MFTFQVTIEIKFNVFLVITKLSKLVDHESQIKFSVQTNKLLKNVVYYSFKLTRQLTAAEKSELKIFNFECQSPGRRRDS